MIVISVATYAAHTRAHYDDLDQLLAGAARHVTAENVGSLGPAQLESVLAEPVTSGVVTRVYDPGGRPVAASPGAGQAPAVDPGAVLRMPSTAAFDPIAGLAPPFVRVEAGRGEFALATAGNGDRWRLYVQPLSPSGRYLEMAASLAYIDDSVERLRLLLLVLGLAGTAAAFGAAWLLASRALRPVRTVTATAAAIERSKSFSSRVTTPAPRDELGELTRTFNAMLESLEAAYRGQQRFVADASHELRAPLTAIQANLELLENQPAMSKEDREAAVVEASREAQRLSRLVAELLALARADAGVRLRTDPVELDRIALESVEEARLTAGSRRVEIDTLEPASVIGDADRLKQLLLILLDNGIKYSPADGDIRLSLQEDGAKAEIRVADSGVGIPEAELPHVFDRFFRADPARSRDPGGSGLGLAIARWIVDQHGGEIRLESRLGQGSEAIVVLPLKRLT